MYDAEICACMFDQELVPNRLSLWSFNSVVSFISHVPVCVVAKTITAKGFMWELTANRSSCNQPFNAYRPFQET